MEWHFNELSLTAELAQPGAFRAALEPVLRLRALPKLQGRIYCSRGLFHWFISPEVRVQQVISGCSDKGFRTQMLSWLANGGPFWDDSRTGHQDDYFQFEGDDVTDRGLGEVARRALIQIEASAFSLPGVRFDRSPLSIQHGLDEDPYGQIEIQNVWELDGISEEESPHPQSWQALLDDVKGRLNLLTFSPDIAAQLRPSPFDRLICERFILLLEVLQVIAEETNNDSSLTPKGMDVYRRHFVGRHPYFTDESTSNKRDFRNELTFPDPLDHEKELFCPWHGKVNQGPSRIHFEWPRPSGQRQIKVVYMGRKITLH